MAEDKKKSDNPAGRLKETLERARGISGGNIKSGFARTFEVPDIEDFGEVYIQLAAFNETADEISAQLKRLDNQRFYEIYLADLPRIKRFAQPWDLRGQWDEYKKHFITDADLKTLEFCSGVLSHACSEGVMPQQDLDRVAELLEAVYKEVSESDLHVDLKALILDELEHIRRAIHEYRLRGVGGLKVAAKRAFATIVLNEELRTSKKKETSRFREVVTTLILLLQLAREATPELKSALSYLELPSAPITETTPKRVPSLVEHEQVDVADDDTSKPPN